MKNPDPIVTLLILLIIATFVVSFIGFSHKYYNDGYQKGQQSIETRLDMAFMSVPTYCEDKDKLLYDAYDIDEKGRFRHFTLDCKTFLKMYYEQNPKMK